MRMLPLVKAVLSAIMQVSTNHHHSSLWFSKCYWNLSVDIHTSKHYYHKINEAVMNQREPSWLCFLSCIIPRILSYFRNACSSPVPLANILWFGLTRELYCGIYSIITIVYIAITDKYCLACKLSWVKEEWCPYKSFLESYILLFSKCRNIQIHPTS